MIESGEKLEEYREIKPYWEKRFIDQKLQTIYDAEDKGIAWKDYTHVIATNGYSKDAPQLEWEHEGFDIGTPNPAWCGPEFLNNEFFILKIKNAKRIR